MSKGGKWEKILAINLLMDHFRTFPREKGKKILIRLARKNQPTSVRFHRAIKLYCNKTTEGDGHR
ncbi:MAG: hypothetical protein WBL67_00930 [Nitrososphaeraceae archaeon]